VAVQPTHTERSRTADRVAAASDYTARHLSVLEGLEAVRKRPGMYIGSTDSAGLMHCLWEIIDNAVDEALAGFCHRSRRAARRRLRRRPRRRAGHPGRRRAQDGPVRRRGGLTKLHAGGKFGGGSYARRAGLHGVGASVVNALSARLDVAVDRDGRTHVMSFRRGEPGRLRRRPAGPDPDAPFTPFVDRSELRVTGRSAAASPAPGCATGPTGRSSCGGRLCYDELVPARGRPATSCRA
jgi:DNA gyrase subunit B